MLAAIIPAKNEANNLPLLYKNLAKLPFDKIITVVNGCTDHTLDILPKIKAPNHFMIYFTKSLGFDIPRAIGALKAYQLGCNRFCFIDGDMTGDINPVIIDIIKSLDAGTDLALTNCYPLLTQHTPQINAILNFRNKLNQLGAYYTRLGLASPSQGPHGISYRLLQSLSILDIAIPPTLLVYAAQNNLKVEVAAAMPSHRLGPQKKDPTHTAKIAQTNIGDCLEAIAFAQGNPRTRIYQNHHFNGYNQERRFDLLLEYGSVLGII